MCGLDGAGAGAGFGAGAGVTGAGAGAGFGAGAGVTGAGAGFGAGAGALEAGTANSPVGAGGGTGVSSDTVLQYVAQFVELHMTSHLLPGPEAPSQATDPIITA